MISPLLWNLIVDSLLKEAKKIQWYADDLVLSMKVQGKVTSTTADMMNNGLKFINNWYLQESIRVNPAKMAVVPLFYHQKNTVLPT